MNDPNKKAFGGLVRRYTLGCPILDRRQSFTMSNSGTKAIKILVAEANDAIRRRIVGILHGDFQVIGAVSNGTDLMQTALNLAPHAIVSDISLPEIGGVEAWRQLKGRGNELPFVFLTTERDVSDHLRVLPAAYVHKLDLPTNLNAAVRSALAGKIYLSHRCRKSRQSE